MTRMWMVEPEEMCDQHLLGEHKELHQIVGHIRAGNESVVEGHAEKGQVDTARIERRHEELVEEMEDRGFDHGSPMEYEDDLEMGRIEVMDNREELRERCEDCRERMER